MRTADKLNNFKAYLGPAMNQKLALMRAEGRDVINLGLGDPDVTPPEHQLKALTEAVSNPDNHHYPSAYPIKPFYDAIAAKAVGFYEALQPSFVDYQRAVLDNALALASELSRLGLRIVSGGTDNHLMLVDLTKTGVSGIEAQEALGATGIVVNRNTIPFDPQPPMIASGIRLGSPAVTTRGFGVEEMKRIASLIVKVLNNIDKPEVQKQVKEEVSQICQRFPVPGID